MRIYPNFSYVVNGLRENILSSLSERNKKMIACVTAAFIFLTACFLTYRYCKKTTLPFKAVEKDSKQLPLAFSQITPPAKDAQQSSLPLSQITSSEKHPQQPSLPVSNIKTSAKDPQQPPLLLSQKESPIEKLPNTPPIVQQIVNSEETVEIDPQKNVSTTQPLEKVEVPKQFNKYELDLFFSEYSTFDKENAWVNTPSDIKPMLKIIEDRLALDPLAKVQMNFTSPVSVEEIETRIKLYQDSSSILQFELSKGVKNSITATVKLLNYDIKDDSQVLEYANGVKEEITPLGYRIFPNGVRIFGTFDYIHNRFFQKYRIEKDGKIEFISPNRLFTHFEKDKESSKFREYIISECEGELIVLENILDKQKSHYEKVKKPVWEVLWNSVEYSPAIKLKQILTHPLFKDDLPKFIQHSLTIEEESGTPHLFTLPPDAAAEIVDVAAKTKSINPSQLVDKSGKNLFIHAAELAKKPKKHALLAKLIEHFPNEYKSISQIMKCLPTFIGNLLHIDNDKVPYLFGLPSATAIEILNAAIEEKVILQSLDHQVNVFTTAANHTNPQFLEKLIAVYPSLFSCKDPDIIGKCILEATPIPIVQKLSDGVKKVGGEVTYYELWLHLAEGKKPDEKFNEQFAKLSTSNQELLRNAAKAYGNIYVDEIKPL